MTVAAPQPAVPSQETEPVNIWMKRSSMYSIRLNFHQPCYSPLSAMSVLQLFRHILCICASHIHPIYLWSFKSILLICDTVFSWLEKWKNPHVWTLREPHITTALFAAERRAAAADSNLLKALMRAADSLRFWSVCLYLQTQPSEAKQTNKATKREKITQHPCVVLYSLQQNEMHFSFRSANVNIFHSIFYFCGSVIVASQHTARREKHHYF